MIGFTEAEGEGKLDRREIALGREELAETEMSPDLSSTLAPIASRLEVVPLPTSSRRSQWFWLPPSLRKRRAGPLLTVRTTSRSPSPSISA